jgi:colanic acid biosynthesis glycosyl transferase WcaI
MDRKTDATGLYLPFSDTRVALLISLYFPPEIGGGSSGAWNRALSLQKLGFLVFVLCGFPAYPSGRITDKKYRWKIFSIERQDDINIIRIRLPSIEHKGYIRRLFLFLLFVLLTLVYLPLVVHTTGRLSLVYARSPVIFSNLSGICYSKLYNSFYIYETPDLWPEELSVFNSPLMPLINKVGKIMARIAYETPDIIVTVSSSARDYICENYKPSRPVFGIPVGVNPRNFKQIEKLDALHELIRQRIIPSQIEDKFLVVYSGLISPAQNLDVLIDVAKKLNTMTEVAFLIVGDGEDKKRLEELIKRNKLQSTFLIERQPRHLMPKIIGAADICAVTLSQESIFDIAIPTKFYEYIACSKPIVGVCKGELADIIESYDVGYAFRSLDETDEIAETITYLKESPERYAELEQNCRVAAAEFSVDSISLKFKRILDRYDINHRPTQ